MRLPVDAGDAHEVRQEREAVIARTTTQNQVRIVGRDVERIRRATTLQRLHRREQQRPTCGTDVGGVSRRETQVPSARHDRATLAVQRVVAGGSLERRDVVEAGHHSRHVAGKAVDRTTAGQIHRHRRCVQSEVQFGAGSAINRSHNSRESVVEVDVVVTPTGSDVAGQCGHQIDDVCQGSTEQVDASGSRDVERVAQVTGLQVGEVAEGRTQSRVVVQEARRRAIHGPSPSQRADRVGQSAVDSIVASDHVDVINAADVIFGARKSIDARSGQSHGVDRRPLQRVAPGAAI